MAEHTRLSSLAIGLALVAAVAAGAQEEGAVPTDGEPERWRLDWGFEAKAHYRDSDLNAFRNPFFCPPNCDPSFFLTTVNEGQHFEVSGLTLRLDAALSDLVAARAKVDFIDLHDRNPTSTDKKVDVDEAWVRFGRETDPAREAYGTGVYLKVGKFGHFERQNDRHLESYGLVSTAFNRFEDVGAELGLDLGKHVYVKVSATQGNPVFLRDPNALAGDNGTDARFDPSNPPSTPLKSGVVVLYDAEVEDLDVDGELELGAGLGWRFESGSGRGGVDVLAWTYRRDLAATVELEGTNYGGDLDLLNGPGDAFGLPISGDEKEETGLNLWIYQGGFSFFGQFVDQEIAGMDRTGLEAEVAWSFALPLRWAVAGRQLFPYVAPAVRYSKLDPDFDGGSPIFPAPSLRWEWEKIDVGVRLGLLEGIDLTLEYADNSFFIPSLGRDGENNEVLTTLRWRM